MLPSLPNLATLADRDWMETFKSFDHHLPDLRYGLLLTSLSLKINMDSESEMINMDGVHNDQH